jgi:hypothetical protein
MAPSPGKLWIAELNSLLAILTFDDPQEIYLIGQRHAFLPGRTGQLHVFKDDANLLAIGRTAPRLWVDR